MSVFFRDADFNRLSMHQWKALYLHTLAAEFDSVGYKQMYTELRRLNVWKRRSSRS